MKKIFFVLFLAVIAILNFNMKGQYAPWEPIRPYGQPEEAQYEQIYGYVNTSHGWERVMLKLKITRYSTRVVAYLEKNNSGYAQFFSSNGPTWRSCNASVEPVRAYYDGQEAANNFTYKASVSGLGKVFF